MIINRIFITFLFLLFLTSCATYNTDKVEKKFYSSSGFALVYSDSFFTQRVVSKKINNEKLDVMHDILKINTPIRITNPINSKFVETKVTKRADYPPIFNIVISNKIASILELDLNDPHVEIFEIKKNETFVAKKANTFDEEKNVAETVPVEKIKIDDLSSSSVEQNENKTINNFVIVINDFYYKESAISLKKEIVEKTQIINISVKKINDKKYRLLAGPFKNFNTLKTAYISLNNLGFEHLNIYNN